MIIAAIISRWRRQKSHNYRGENPVFYIRRDFECQRKSRNSSGLCTTKFSHMSCCAYGWSENVFRIVMFLCPAYCGEIWFELYNISEHPLTFALWKILLRKCADQNIVFQGENVTDHWASRAEGRTWPWQSRRILSLSVWKSSQMKHQP